MDVGDLGTQVARSSSQTQKMDLDEFDLRWTSDFEKQPPRRRRQLPHEQRSFVKARTTQQDLGSWGIANPRDVELYAPGVVEAYCLACRFNDYPVGQADVAFRAMRRSSSGSSRRSMRVLGQCRVRQHQPELGG